jgi:CRISPR-associated protein (TIGR03986 family)
MPNNNNNQWGYNGPREHQQSYGGQNNKVIKAPFNFVPLPTVFPNAPFLPAWGEQVSLDYPFKEGMSGKITLKIKAITDIFIRNCKEGNAFHNINGKYCIPGSSIKGMLRSALEIATFGKFTQYNNSRFSYRDLNSRNYRILIHDIRAGWLCIHNDTYYLFQCSNESIDPKSDRITATEIDQLIGSDAFQPFITESDFRTDKNRNAKTKYELYCEHTGLDINQLKNLFLKIESGTHNGKYLVMTGQPSQRRDADHKGKNKEFVFPTIPPIDNKNNVVINASDQESWHKLSQAEVDIFRSIHRNSSDFVNFYDKILKHGGAIPVFYKIINEGQSKKYYLGLTYMLKYPTKHDISDAIPYRFRDPNTHDLADLIFGYVNKSNSADTLKGRIHVGHAFANNVQHDNVEKKFVLSSPKASYYPLYLGNNSWNSDIEISGYKRYPTRNSVEEQGNINNMNDKMLSKVIPLKAGTDFTSIITFHNLNQIELGAILYVIKKLKFHQLGGIKPFGYGKVQIKPSLTFKDEGDIETDKLDSFIDPFVNKFDELYPGWQHSDTIQELKAMASGIYPNNEDKFRYMNMSTNRQQNEFAIAKERHEHLELFSKIKQIRN